MRNLEASLQLSADGLFPLPIEAEGGLSALGLPYAGTLQGEGLYLGVPSLFLRLAGCNMRCAWTGVRGETITCDTRPAQSLEGSVRHGIAPLVDALIAHRGTIDHLVITGGEPFLQEASLAAFLRLLRARTQRRPFHITIETNGSRYSSACAGLIDFVSISPKLQSVRGAVGLPEETYIAALQAWLDAKTAPAALQLKFVLAHEREEEAIDQAFLTQLAGYEQHPVFLMPMGATTEQIQQASAACVAICIRRNWRYSPRLHIDLWGAKEGV